MSRSARILRGAVSLAAELLSALETQCHVKFKDLTTVPAYAEFVKSPEYQTWFKSHRGSEETPRIIEPRTK